MSQSRNLKVQSPRSRHAKSNSDKAQSKRLSMVKAVESSNSRSNNPPFDYHESRRSKSKNKIPKTLRYDLESALVGLCDVWFENIKPHLVRNNIKLHVHNTATASDVSCACGDLDQPTSNAPLCKHLDPGAACDLVRHKNAFYAGSFAMQPIASAAPCFKPQTSIQYQNQTPYECLQRFNTNKTRIKRKSSIRRASRLLQTTKVISSSKILPTRRERNVYECNLYKSIFNKVPICPPTSPAVIFPKYKSTATQSISRDNQMNYAFLENLHTLSQSRNAASSLQHKVLPKTLLDQSILFQDDLIEIIGKRSDEIFNNSSGNQCQQKAGYSCPVYLESPNRRQKADSPKKNPPWR